MSLFFAIENKLCVKNKGISRNKNLYKKIIRMNNNNILTYKKIFL